MEEISIEALYELYQDTLIHCRIEIIDETDEIIENEIFEEFALDVVSFLHQESLQKLYDKGFISKANMEKSLILRKKVLDLENTQYWNINSVRTSDGWKDIFKLSEEIRHSEIR